MDSDGLRSILVRARVDVWELIDSAIAVASSDYPSELKQRRDRIVEALYSTAATCNRCTQSEGAAAGGSNRREREVGNNSPSPSPAAVVSRGGGGEAERRRSPVTPVEDEFAEEDPYAGFFDEDIQSKVMEIKQQLEEPDQSEEYLAELLQSLDDMDITFSALNETDIGRNVNRLRKNPSNEVKRLVKKLVRKWKEIVDDWVRTNPDGGHGGSSAFMADGDSPQQQRITQNGNHHQVPDFAYSPNPNNGSSGSDRNYSEEVAVVRKPKPPVSGPVRREAPPARQAQQHSSSTTPHNQRQQQQQQQPKKRGTNDDFDSDKLASATKRMQESYKELQNAKKQRIAQVIDPHDLPKAKNTFFKNRGGSSQGRR